MSYYNTCLSRIAGSFMLWALNVTNGSNLWEYHHQRFLSVEIEQFGISIFRYFFCHIAVIFWFQLAPLDCLFILITIKPCTLNLPWKKIFLLKDIRSNEILKFTSYQVNVLPFTTFAQLKLSTVVSGLSDSRLACFHLSYIFPSNMSLWKSNLYFCSYKKKLSLVRAPKK